jgi:hypothetical protein
MVGSSGLASPSSKRQAAKYRRRLRQRDGLEFANQLAMHDRLDAARTLGDRDPIVADCDPASAVVTRLRPALALESGEPCAMFEEVLERLVKVDARLSAVRDMNQCSSIGLAIPANPRGEE